MNVIGPKNDISILDKIFPQIGEIKKTNWEIQSLSNSESIMPGPSDYKLKGLIILEEHIAKEYWEKFEWKEIDVHLDADTFDVCEYNKKKWYYNFKFQQQIVSANVMGKIFFSGKELWFNIVYS